MSQPVPAPAGKGYRTAGKIVAIIGAVIMALTIAGGAVLGSAGFSGDASSITDGTVVSGGGATMNLEANKDLQLYKLQGNDTPECQVSAPDGEPTRDGVHQSSTVTVNGQTWSSFDSFRTGEAGEYLVDCSDQVMVAPPVSIGGIFAGVGGILLAVFGGVGGGVILVIGLVLYFVGRSKRRQAAGY